MSTATPTIQGLSAALRIENLDTDQIMPKQFLRGIDKAGLAKGLLYDLRYDGQGAPRQEFVLNKPAYAGAKILIGGANFGCGSSREHAVWGLQQFGIEAVIAPSFGEIFYSNAMNSRLLLIVLPREQIDAMMVDADDPARALVSIDVDRGHVQGASVNADFEMSPRHKKMFLENLDVIGLSLTFRDRIVEFAHQHWSDHPWLRDVARMTRDRLDQEHAA